MQCCIWIVYLDTCSVAEIKDFHAWVSSSKKYAEPLQTWLKTTICVEPAGERNETYVVQAQVRSWECEEGWRMVKRSKWARTERSRRRLSHFTMSWVDVISMFHRTIAPCDFGTDYVYTWQWSTQMPGQDLDAPHHDIEVKAMKVSHIGNFVFYDSLRNLGMLFCWECTRFLTMKRPWHYHERGLIHAAVCFLIASLNSKGENNVHGGAWIHIFTCIQANGSTASPSTSTPWFRSCRLSIPTFVERMSPWFR